MDEKYMNVSFSFQQEYLMDEKCVNVSISFQKVLEESAKKNDQNVNVNYITFTAACYRYFQSVFLFFNFFCLKKEEVCYNCLIRFHLILIIKVYK